MADHLAAAQSPAASWSGAAGSRSPRCRPCERMVAWPNNRSARLQRSGRAAKSWCDLVGEQLHAVQPWRIHKPQHKMC